jgi:hypothetical protein
MRGLGSIPRKEHGVRSLNAILANVEFLVRDVMKNQGRHREDSRKMLLIAGSWQTQPISGHGSKSVELEVYATSRPATTARQRKNGYLRLNMV